MQENTFGYFNLESPPPLTGIPAGRHQLRGWLVPKPAVHFVDVRARVGAREFAGVYGFPRADLAAHFEPSRPWLPAEFTIEIDITSGVAEVQIDALTLTGQWQLIHTVQLEVHAGPQPVPSAPDPVSAVELGRAMQLLRIATTETKTNALAATVDAIPHPRVIGSDHHSFHGYVAEPAGIAPAFYGQMEFVGWLFHEIQSIQRACVTTDLITFQPLEIGGDFAGVAARFPAQPNAKKCRLSGFVDVSTQLPSPACVRVFAELADGSMHLCMATRCRPQSTEELKRTGSPFSAWQFWQDWRGLKTMLAHRGIALEPGKALRDEFWQSLHDSRQNAVPQSRRGPGTPRPLPAAAENRKLHLLLITHNLNFEGAPLLLLEYARHLVEKCGAEISVLTSWDGPLRAAFEALPAPVTAVDCTASTPAELSHRIREISRQVDLDKIDLVVANTLASFWGVILAHAAGRPSLLYIHESTSPAAFFRKTTPGLLPAVYRAFRHATAVSFNTPATQAYYGALGSGDNFYLNSAWIDLTALDQFRTTHDRNSLRTDLGLQSGELLVANIGTVCERKGQHDFLRAIELLWHRSPALAARCRFIMVGGRDTRYCRDLEKKLTPLGRKKIRIVPETVRAYDYFAAADLFVCTSYEESFPRVILEAMAFAVPIVSTNVHGIPSMLENGTDAILVGPGDIAALTAGMLCLLEDPAKGKVFAQSARQRVAEFAASLLLPRHAAFSRQVAELPGI
ncbi:MAG: glycosyltransferase family 4 protein [Lacunisphaera sp.]